MTVKRLDNVAIVVSDLDAAAAFFEELGLELEGRAPIQGSWADGVVGLDGVHSEIVLLRTPDGHGRVELTSYRSPAPVPASPRQPPSNTIGLHRLMFAVDDVDDAVSRLSRHGATLVGNVEQYEDAYRLCYLRGPDGIIVALAQELGG
ncbi:VOC family protein [Demequina sp.]|uniref:VOC family protein n=1 Tax=Demequina sp. TaxID=2050685 RepID=UPI0025E9C35F|nr:VOC family protein [Demequina sp.]